MLSLPTYTPFICTGCGGMALFKSLRDKFWCVAKPNTCPGLTARMQASRERKWADNPGSKQLHMKQMSVVGNSSSIRQTETYKRSVSEAISSTKIANGAAKGENNPNYGVKYTSDPEIRAKMKRPKLDTSKMGRYVRTVTHREILSKSVSERRVQQKYKDTKIERIIASWFSDHNIQYMPQFLIQTKDHRALDKLFYRHVYDFYLPEYNTIVEVDGEYWHGSVAAQVNDAKASYVAEERGFKVIRICETATLRLLNAPEIQTALFNAITTSNSTFTVFGDLYSTVPTRVG